MVLKHRTALWAIPVSALAGVARHALDVAGSGIPGWDLVFLTPPGPLPAELRARGARVVEAPFGPDHGLPASLRSLRSAAAQTRPEILHAHLSYADIVAAIAKPRGVRLVTTEHGIAAHDLVYHRSSRKAALMAAVHRGRFRRVDAAIAVSRATADAMRVKWGAHDVVVIPNGVDRPAEMPAREPGLRILSLARLAPEKRLPALLRAFAVVAADHTDAHLTVAGVGELEGELKDLASGLGLIDRVTFPGFVDPAPAMADADVVAMLSVWENSPYTVLDAAAAGLGVVTSPAGGHPEIVPVRCLADPDRPADVARALVEQGLDVPARPGLPDWPDVATMCARTAEVYAGVLR
jgi:glycogen(starch) synthase